MISKEQQLKLLDVYNEFTYEQLESMLTDLIAKIPDEYEIDILKIVTIVKIGTMRIYKEKQNG